MGRRRRRRRRWSIVAVNTPQSLPEQPTFFSSSGTRIISQTVFGEVDDSRMVFTRNLNIEIGCLGGTVSVNGARHGGDLLWSRRECSCGRHINIYYRGCGVLLAWWLSLPLALSLSLSLALCYYCSWQSHSLKGGLVSLRVLVVRWLATIDVGSTLDV